MGLQKSERFIETSCVNLSALVYLCLFVYLHLLVGACVFSAGLII